MPLNSSRRGRDSRLIAVPFERDDTSHREFIRDYVRYLDSEEHTDSLMWLNEWRNKPQLNANGRAIVTVPTNPEIL
jgi:hypothetical protein